MKVKLFSYDNPTGRCQDCPLDDGERSCCDDQNRNSNCYGGNPNNIRPCDTFFMFCLRPLNSTGRDCSYIARVTSDTDWQGRDLPIDFTRVPTSLGLDNPLSLPGLTDTYTVSHTIYTLYKYDYCRSLLGY